MARLVTSPAASPPSPRLISMPERDVKLGVEPGFRLPRLPGTTLRRKLITSIYYDTDAHDLAHARMTLRRRIERGKAAWHLKIPLGNDRQEVEADGGQADPPASLRDLLILHLDHGTLMPVATLRVWRTGIRVRQRGRPSAVVVLDSVAVVQNHCVVQRFREVEIKQLGADQDQLKDLDRLLRQAGARDHDGRPKLFRALSLPAPAPDRPPETDAPIMDHVKWALAQHVRWLLAHDPGTRLGLQSESLHHMRVATRRLRALLRAAQPVFVPQWAASLEDELSWLSGILGQARDLDVQLAYFHEEAARLTIRDRKPFAQFTAHLQTQRDRIQQLVVSELTSARYFELIRRLRQAAQDPSVVDTTVTPHEIATWEFKKLRKAVRRLAPSASPAQLHDVRIKTKRARYAAELAMWEVGKRAERFIKQARAVQDLLGSYQDSLTAESHLRAFLKQSASVRAAFVAGRMVERQRLRRDNLLARAKPKLRTLLKCGRKAWS